MKKELFNLIKESIHQIKSVENIENVISKIEISETKNKIHGDFSTNIALILAKELNKSPIELAEILISSFTKIQNLEKTEIAGPGFINFFISDHSHLKIISIVHLEGNKFGRIESTSKSLNILIEYVSSNPTGPLHVGHGRGAAYGSTISNLLRATGQSVEEEYYVNDFGRQMDILTLSVFIRYIERWKELEISYPENCYQGEYIKQIAFKLPKPNNSLHQLYSNEFLEELVKKTKDCSNDKALDELTNFTKGWKINYKKKEKQQPEFEEIREYSLHSILSNIQKDLESFGVKHNNWFYESTLYDDKKSDSVDIVVKDLKSKKLIFEKEGAIWFRSSAFGDDKDRVVIRENLEKTYFASDIAYHHNKYNRGFDKIINIWGSDHHGYFPRVSGAIEALGHDKDKLHIIFVQFANLIRNKKKVSMSTRGGNFVSLNELINEVSQDAARFFYIMRKADQHLDFDLDLAKDQSKDNPLYYIQYAHARICSILKESSNEFNSEIALEREDYLGFLNSPAEIELCKQLKVYPEIIRNAAEKYEPHLVCYFLRELASNFHSYYNNERILIKDKELQSSRLLLIGAIKQVMANGLEIIGVSAPESM
tara:strand:- start:13556 stop:15349 length:1794 start_codon:yes stop_codon:yes gene_type:complete